MPGVGLEVKQISTPPKCNIFGKRFLEFHILATTYQKAFILVPKVAFTSFHGNPGSVPGVGSEVKI